jgi:NAD(P)-dependent dehydrogenase (short-subunit alcohol dehydrogenase family)
MSEKTVFVTGGSRGIGKSIVLEFLNNDYNVVIGFKTNKKLALELAEKQNALPIYVDISKRSSIINAIKKTEKEFGGIDILINNAGISQEKPFEKISDKDWDKMLKVNLGGVFSFTQEVLPKMKKKKWGRIINISSIGGQWGGYNQVHYAAAKAGVINFTKSIGKIYSEFGITCNTISPGLVLTDMSKKEISSKQGIKKIKNIPIGRIANTEEISSVALFLSSKNASYITGQTINVNGGMYFN